MRLLIAYLILFALPAFAQDGAAWLSVMGADAAAPVYDYSTAYDVTGNGHDGTCSTTNILTLESGTDFYGQFNGADYITLADDPAWDLGTTNDFSIVIWFKTTSTDTRMLFNRDTVGGDLDAYFAGGDLYMRIGSASGLLIGAGFNDGTWRMLTITFDYNANPQVTAYINTTVEDTSNTDGDKDGTAVFYIGRRSAGNYFAHELDDFRFYRHEAITSGDVSTLHSAGRNAAADAIDDTNLEAFISMIPAEL